MPSQKSIPISELITTANSELLRLDFKRSALQIYCAEFRKFSDYYSNEKIQDYTATMKWPQKVRQYSEVKIVQAAERACCLWIAGGKPFSFALILRLL